MWVSKKKWHDLEKRVADLEKKVKDQPVEKIEEELTKRIRGVIDSSFHTLRE